jgi:mono/diheme cytochrome c family protein
MHSTPSCQRANTRSRGRAAVLQLKWRLTCLSLPAVCALSFCAPSQAVAEDTVAARAKAAEPIFQRICAQCHGPDGKGGPQRSTMPAIPNFTDPLWQKSRSSAQLTISILEGKNRQMPANRGPVSDDQAPALVAYVRTFGPQSGPTPEIGGSDYDVEFKKLSQQWDELSHEYMELKSASAAPSVGKETTAQALAAKPFTPDDVDRGRDLFVGDRPLAAGGASCIACHAIHGSGPREGGRLGPDLTKICERAGDRAALTAQLMTPTTPMMRAVYRDHALEPDEVASLAAYLEETDKHGVEQASAPPQNFLLMGLGGTVLGLTALSGFWTRFGPRKRPSINGKVPAARRSEFAGQSKRQATRAAETPAGVAARSGNGTTMTRHSEEYLASGL